MYLLFAPDGGCHALNRNLSTDVDILGCQGP